MRMIQLYRHFYMTISSLHCGTYITMTYRSPGFTSIGRWYSQCTNMSSPEYQGLACLTMARKRGCWISTASERRTKAFTCAKLTPTRWSVKSVICRWSVSPKKIVFLSLEYYGSITILFLSARVQKKKKKYRPQ